MSYVMDNTIIIITYQMLPKWRLFVDIPSKRLYDLNDIEIKPDVVKETLTFVDIKDRQWAPQEESLHKMCFISTNSNTSNAYYFRVKSLHQMKAEDLINQIFLFNCCNG